MTMRISGLYASVLVVAAVLWSAPLAAVADDRASIDAGRAIGRALLTLRDPRACAIPLLRDRCRSDVDAFAGTSTDADYATIPNIGPHPLTGLRAFVTNGDRDGYDRALAYINSRSSTAAMWTADARNAALYDAGIEDVLYHAAGSNTLAQLLGSGALIDLTNHASAIPAGALGVDVPAAGGGSPRGAGMLDIADRLVRAVDAAAPPAPLAPIPQRDDPAAIAGLGVAGSVVNELVDSPPWLFQADAQTFVDAFAQRLTAFAPSAAVQAAALRAATRPGPSFSHDVAIRAYNATVEPTLAGQRHAQAYMLGALTTQMVYNAAVLRDPNVARMGLGVISSIAALDAAVPGWAAARVQSNSIAPTAWSAQYALGVQLVGLIEKANQP
jgi:hypothetical protein